MTSVVRRLWLWLRYGVRLERVDGEDYQYILRSTRLLSPQDVEAIERLWR